MAEENKPKKVFEEEFKCPHCKRYIIIKKEKTLVTPSEPAEYNEKITVELSKQSKLTDIKKKSRKLIRRKK